MKDKNQKMEIVNSMEKVDVNALALQEMKRTIGNAMWKVPGCVAFRTQAEESGERKLGISDNGE